MCVCKVRKALNPHFFWLVAVPCRGIRASFRPCKLRYFQFWVSSGWMDSDRITSWILEVFGKCSSRFDHLGLLCYGSLRYVSNVNFVTTEYNLVKFTIL
jgi:hypothetical protein